jgi:tetratricopeptide (TPR) repeat protein
MYRRIFLLGVLFSALPGSARDHNENWIEVRSDHFVVATDASEKKARQIADQFERMRTLFRIAMPKLQADPYVPIVVIAVKDDKDFRDLEPSAYLAKGQIKLGGLFLHTLDKNYVLMRVDAEGEHPYEVIYHEYTHLLLSKDAEWLPLWLNEGLAEFYQNTDLREKEAAVGQPSADDILLLRQNRLLPLTTLFTVDARSPYYHEENKGSIFYAESWALTHYFEMRDFREKSHELDDYAELLSQHADPVTAATRSFGDLNRLQAALAQYVEKRDSFNYWKIAVATEVDQSAFKSRALPANESDALRADFLAYDGRTADAHALLDQVLRDDPKNVLAHETMGFLESEAGHLDEARKWYEQAVQLDSQSYLAHYYFAAMSMRELPQVNISLNQDEHSDTPRDEDSQNKAQSKDLQNNDAKIESSLRTAIKLNPKFAPAFDLLAVFLGTRQRNLDEAHMMGLTAVSLDPGNVGYRLNVSHVLLIMRQANNAVRVLEETLKIAKTPEEIQSVNQALGNARAFAEAQKQAQEMEDARRRALTEAPTGGGQAGAVEASASVDGPALRRDKFVAKGPHHYLVGLLKNVHCDSEHLDLTVTSSVKTIALHAENYFQIQFSALNFKPSPDLNPCKDLEGRPAKVEYVESANASAAARVLSVELHK